MSARGRPPYPDPPPSLAVPTVDNHCHLDIAEAGEYGMPAMSTAEALARAAAVGVDRVVQVGCDVASARWSADLADADPRVLATVALHPNDAARLAAGGGDALDEAFAVVEELAGRPRVRAVGETGLDFFRTGPDGHAAQEESFRRHVALAVERDLALVVHDRDAHADVVRVLVDAGAPERTVFHCFSGDADLVRMCAAHGWYVSFAGTVTYRNATSLQEAARLVPPDRLLVETDAPFLPPVPHRGAPNASFLVPLTVRFLAELRGETEERVAELAARNAEAVYGPW